MSKSRQTEMCPKLPSPVTALAFDLDHGHIIPAHAHLEDQLVYASKGVMTVRTSEGIWVVPPQRAVWIPATTPHSLQMSGAVSMRTVYLRPRMAKRLPRTCSVVNVSPLLQQLIIHLCTYKELSRRSRSQARLIDLLIDLLETVQAVPLQLPNPSDARAVRVATALQNDPEGSLEGACQHAGASKRTIERLFHQETRLSLGKWRQQLRLMRSLQLLAAGEKISYAALEAGYGTPSAFIAMFRKALGTTPRKYFQSLEDAESATNR
jgi:AraC-like DNA-binding protein